MQSYPETVIVSLVDATEQVVRDQWFYSPLNRLLYGVQRHYGVHVMDFAKMVRLLHKNESYYTSQLSSNEIFLQHYLNNTSHNLTEPLDLLWPQSSYMITSDGTKVNDFEAEKVNPVYWPNFLPRVQKTKGAYYPNNHPPWPTHQYVADAITYLFLKVVQRGLGCEESELDESSSPLPMKITEETVANKADVDSCFICLSPSMRIDARSTRYIANFTSPTNTTNKHPTSLLHHKHPVIVTCGDWKWITDNRNRAGWQSEQPGSMIRFRLNVSSAEPTISMMYMGSYEKFGKSRVTFRAITREEEEAPPLGCGDIDNNPYGDKSNSSNPMPSMELSGYLPKHSLWKAAVFPKQIERHDGNARGFWNLLNQTVLGRKDMEYVDMYVENPN